MILQPSQLASASVEDLLREAGRGRLGVDQRWMRAVVAQGDAAAQALIAYGLNPPEDGRVELDEDILNALAALPAADGMPFIVELLRQGYSEIPEAMVELAQRAGRSAADALLALYREMDEESAGEVAFLLAGLGIRDERVYALLLERLEFDMEDGSMLLAMYGDPAGLEPLLKLSAEVGKNRELDFAIEQLRASNGEPYRPEIDFIGLYEEVSGPQFEVLDDEEIVEFACEHEEESVRLEALDILEDLELPASIAPPLLELAQGSASLPVRAAAFRALARLNQLEEVRQLAERMANATAAPAALRAAAVIAALPDGLPGARVRELIAELVQDPAGRPDAVHAMWRSREAIFATRFGTFLDDPDLAVRRQAVRGAGVCGDVTAVGKLRALLMDDDLRPDAIFAYALAVPSDVSPSRMRSLYSRIEKEAGGLNQDEATSVGIALDMRLEAAGKDPIFFAEDEDDAEPLA